MTKIEELRQALKHPRVLTQQPIMPKRLLTNRELKEAEQALKIIRTILDKAKDANNDE